MTPIPCERQIFLVNLISLWEKEKNLGRITLKPVVLLAVCILVPLVSGFQQAFKTSFSPGSQNRPAIPMLQRNCTGISV